MNKFKIYALGEYPEDTHCMGVFEWNKLPHMLYPSNYKVCLFSGIKDHEGQELFEGDRVYVIDTTNTFILKFGKIERLVIPHTGGDPIKVEINCFYFESEITGEPCFSIVENFLGEHDLQRTKLIGNIYEE